jgi:two-component system response regulator DctR
MHFPIEGLPNEIIADNLSISMRTVQAHRARIFAKMGIRSVVERANLRC